jgi:hypothetical protein
MGPGPRECTIRGAFAARGVLCHALMPTPHARRRTIDFSLKLMAVGAHD